MLRAVIASLAVAAASLAVVDPAPSYDAWMWLLWGRELAAGTLDTTEGPAFKPLPVAICALLSPLGAAAPWAWLLLARGAAVLAVVLAFGAGRRLGGSAAAGVLAGAGVALTGHFLGYAASGVAEGILVAFALAAADLTRRRRPRAATACAVACGLLRVETWPFLLVAGVFAWRRRPSLRPALAAACVLVPAAWFLPELLGSGDLLRSGQRAQIPNPGQPALAAVPAVAALRAGLGLVPVPLWAGLAMLAATVARPRWPARPVAVAALAPAAVGCAWLALVALMAQLGFSGEARYSLPGAVLLAISGAAGLALTVRDRLGRVPLGVVTGLVLAIVIAPRVPSLIAVEAAQGRAWRLGSELAVVVDRAGGRDAVLACGTPYVGRLRGPLLAYRLKVAKRLVEPDAPPRAPGVVFRSALSTDAAATPAAPRGFEPVAHSPLWEVLADCRRPGSAAAASASN